MKNLNASLLLLFVLIGASVATTPATASTTVPSNSPAPAESAAGPSAAVPADNLARPTKGRFIDKWMTRMLEKKLDRQARKHGWLAGEGVGDKKKKKQQKGDAWNGIAMGFGLASWPLIALAFLTYVPLAHFLLIFGVIFGVLGLIFGIVGLKKKYKHRGMGIAAVISSGISIGALLTAFLVFTIAAIVLLY